MNSKQSDPTCCAVCGGPLPPGAGALICPQCAFGGALALGSGDSAVGAKATAMSGPETGPESQPKEDQPIQQFGDYELLEEIARGGMGIVYKARQKSLNRLVALKMIRAGGLASQAEVKRFQAEAQAIAQLQHPNIVAIHEVGEIEGRQFFSMDYIAGLTLAEILREGPLPAKRAAGYLKVIAEAVQCAHSHGILHRDLKPSNVLIDESDQPRITDFGLAKRLSGDAELTLPGQILGSPNYLSPEQAAGRNAEVGPPSDVYALGAMLYHLLTGRPPFQADSLTTLLRQVMEAEPVAPRLLNASIPRDLETVCLKCLEKEPARRYATAQALAEELGRFLEQKPILARPISPVSRAARWCQRRPVRAVLIAALVMSLLAGGWGVLWQWRRAEAHRRRSEAGELAARQNAYAADMNLAQHALAANNLGRAETLLNRNRPQPGQRDLRGWEWRYLWQQCQSDALAVLCRRSNYINSLTVASDGTTLAVGEYGGGGLSVWDLHARQAITNLPAGEGAVRAAFSPRGALLAFSSETGVRSTNYQCRVRLWDASAQRMLAVELPLAGPCLALAFSDDGRRLFASTPGQDVQRPGRDGQLVVWQVPEGMKLAGIPAPQTPNDIGTPVAATRDLSVAVVTDPNKGTRLFDLSSGAVRWSATPAVASALTLAFSPDGKLLATGAGTAVRLWEATSGKQLGPALEGHGAWISQLLFWPDGRTLASASADQTIRLWDVSDPTQARSLGRPLRGHKSEVWRLALLPDNTTLVSGCKDGSVCLWDTAQVRLEPAAPARLTNVAAWGFAPDSQSVWTVDRQGRVARWQGTQFQEREPVMEIGPIARRYNYYTALFSDDGRWLAAGATNGSVRVWDLPQRSLRREVTTPARWPGPCKFLAQGTSLVIMHADGFLREWDLSSGEQIRAWESAPDSVGGAFSPDGRWCLTLSRRKEGASLLRNLATGRETTLHLELIVDYATFSPDGRLFAGAAEDGVKLWQMAPLREVATLGGFMLEIHSVAFSPDGRRVIAGSNAKEAIKLWDAESYQELLTLGGEGAMFRISAFTPDGDVLGSMNELGVLHLWRAPSWAVIEAAEKGPVAP
jgi:WD40 repeat protein/tRNA A-37 threonylcarbamoyl transferase component Bud32